MLQNHVYYGDEAFAGDSSGLGLGQRLNFIFNFGGGYRDGGGCSRLIVMMVLVVALVVVVAVIVAAMVGTVLLFVVSVISYGCYSSVDGSDCDCVFVIVVIVRV